MGDMYDFIYEVFGIGLVNGMYYLLLRQFLLNFGYFFEDFSFF